jgi:hypothetical protein
MSGELEIMWKVTAVVCFKVLTRHSSGRAEDKMKNLRIIGVTAEI